MGHFCLNCGTPLGTRLVEGRELEACEACGFVLWHDPKVVTLIVVEDSAGDLVLGRRAIEPGYGLWCLPGGFVNDDEPPAQSAIRECEEEIGAQVVITGLLGVYHIARDDAASMVAIGYRARLREGEVPSAGPEMLEVGTFAPSRVPDLVFPSHQQALLDWFSAGEQSPYRVSPYTEEP
ncbi:MAG: NUDIX hydrolase [Candidatus Dormibacteraeota bacterium]|nr:NUDIX hydrolase [Candidatus Dormibacteraeota bacterium]